jgi:hypothetical protein
MSGMGGQQRAPRLTGDSVQVAVPQDEGQPRNVALKRGPRKPRHPDGVVEDGHDGTAIGDLPADADRVSVHPGNLWRHKPKVQIRHIKEALKRLTSAMRTWNEAAAAAFVPGQRSMADDVLAGIWQRRELRLRQLKWLRSEIPVDPVTGKDLEGEEEDKDEG